MLIKDQLGREIFITNTPKRIVSLVPSQTELLVSLGLKKNIVGVTKFCVHPKSIKEGATIVGGTKKINFDKIRLLNPDIIICNKEENTKEIVDVAANISNVWVSDIYTIDDVLTMIDSFGKIFNTTNKAKNLCYKIKVARNDFKLFVKDKSSRKVAYLIWKHPYMAAGKNTFINELLELNKLENFIQENNSRYPEITLDQLANVDELFLSSEPYPFKEEECEELKNVLNCKVRLVDGEYFSWYGSRLLEAFDYFKKVH